MGKRERALRQQRLAQRALEAKRLSGTVRTEGGAPGVEVTLPASYDAEDSVTPSNVSKHPRKMARRATRKPFDWATWITRAVIGLIAAVGIFFGLQAAGVFSPPPADLSSLDEVATSVKQNDPVGNRQAAQTGVHVPNNQRVNYNTVPPTSGSHWSATAGWGVKDNQEPNERMVHNLEHGGIVISYNKLSEEEITSLKSLVTGLNRAGYRKIILQPYPELADARVAIAAWGWMIKSESVDKKAIYAFTRAHHEGKDAPEPKAP